MEKVVPKNAYYEIKEPLGQGVTSQVYKAFRRDPEGVTRQEVALKIIHSKNDVQILKQEFDTLSRVRSKYCVRILAWESLPKGPALVLEFIDGVTLHELIQENDLSAILANEILVQVKLGLSSLHRSGVYHGDLNLKNIMVNKSGVVKLIDFGFGDGRGEQCLTPLFASKDRLQGNPPTAHSDLHSLAKIKEFLFRDKKALFTMQMLTTRACHRRELGRLVQQCGCLKGSSTQRITAHEDKKQGWIGTKHLISAITLLLLLLRPSNFFGKPQYHPLNLRSDQWFQYSINAMPMRYGPLEDRRLRKGRYTIDFQGAKGKSRRSFELIKPETFLLQLKSKIL